MIMCIYKDTDHSMQVEEFMGYYLYLKINQKYIKQQIIS